MPYRSSLVGFLTYTQVYTDSNMHDLLPHVFQMITFATNTYSLDAKIHTSCWILQAKQLNQVYWVHYPTLSTISHQYTFRERELALISIMLGVVQSLTPPLLLKDFLSIFSFKKKTLLFVRRHRHKIIPVTKVSRVDHDTLANLLCCVTLKSCYIIIVVPLEHYFLDFFD